MYSITYLDSTTHETIFCRQLFAGDVMGSQPMKSKGNALNDNKLSLNIQVIYIEIHFQWDGVKREKPGIQGLRKAEEEGCRYCQRKEDMGNEEFSALQA